MSEDPLTTPVRYVHGVGPDRAALLERLGIRTVEDLLWNVPRDVLDLSDVRPPERLEEGKLQTVRGTVVDIDSRTLSAGRFLVAVLLQCGRDYVRGKWFNQSWPLQRIRHGEVLLFSGKPKRFAGRWEFAHPNVQWVEEDDPQGAPPGTAASVVGWSGGILPRYGLTEGLKMHEIRRIVRQAVTEYASLVPEHLPEPFRKTQRLPPIGEALTRLHLPSNREQYESGRRRLIFDDLFEFQLGLALKRRAWKGQDRAPALPTTAKIDARIRRLFPFSFTEGQNQAVREITADVAGHRAMHRLLQADVGAGKTAVALYVMLVAVAAGYQAVLMAPTEVLANQHWATVEQVLAHSRVKRLLLTGQLTAAQRRQALTDIGTGDVQLVVGTQAVIQEDVEFGQLGIAVIDEQHKFGVLQRAHFSKSGERRAESREPEKEVRTSTSGSPLSALCPPQDLQPHVLVMTATPIPRSLCLTQFGDLDVTTISEMPPGRQKVVTTRVAGAEARKRAWNFLRAQLRKGRQAYVVCPRVEASNPSATNHLPVSAEEVSRQLQRGELRDYTVDLIHGQMDSKRKADVMESFRSGRTQVLVSTTVVEVGVDVPNATLMVVMQAEYFGLAQLHQLRGRIARGLFQGYCFLFSEADSEDAQRRLGALESTSDGFKIAEVDFELRGPGDVLGTRQHGQLPLKVADLVRDHKTLNEARRAAEDLVKSGEFDDPHFAPLKIRVLERFGRLMDLPQSG